MALMLINGQHIASLDNMHMHVLKNEVMIG